MRTVGVFFSTTIEQFNVKRSAATTGSSDSNFCDWRLPSACGRSKWTPNLNNSDASEEVTLSLSRMTDVDRFHAEYA